MTKSLNYQELSDYEINKLIAERRGAIRVWSEEDSYNECGYDGVAFAEINDNYSPLPKMVAYRFTGLVEQAWPLIVEKGITVGPNDFDGKPNEWGAICPSCTYIVTHENPLRAAMIVYLMLTEK